MSVDEDSLDVCCCSCDLPSNYVLAPAQHTGADDSQLPTTPAHMHVRMYLAGVNVTRTAAQCQWRIHQPGIPEVWFVWFGLTPLTHGGGDVDIYIYIYIL